MPNPYPHSEAASMCTFTITHWPTNSHSRSKSWWSKNQRSIILSKRSTTCILISANVSQMCLLLKMPKSKAKAKLSSLRVGWRIWSQRKWARRELSWMKCMVGDWGTIRRENKICRDKFLWLINYETCILWTNQTRLNFWITVSDKVGCLSIYYPSLENGHHIDEEVMGKLVEVDMMVADLKCTNSQVTTAGHRNFHLSLIFHALMQSETTLRQNRVHSHQLLWFILVHCPIASSHLHLHLLDQVLAPLLGLWLQQPTIFSW